MTLHQLVKKYCLNQQYLARQMGMPWSTFKNKLNDADDTYRFTPGEHDKLAAMIWVMTVEMASDVGKIASQLESLG